MHLSNLHSMRNLSLRIANLAIAFCVAWSCGASSSFGQLAPSNNVALDAIRSPLAEGKRLEQENRWQEAILHYEKAFKKDNRLKDCSERLQICRIHYDVTRRYSDRSFMQTVDNSTPTDALQVLSEVLSKLEVYYVEQVDYYKLALHGTAFLEVALTEQDFLGKHLRNADATAVEQFRKTIHKSVFGRKIQNVEELKATVSYVANIASQQIGLMPSAVIYEYIAGSVGLLDPYSALLTPGEYREVMSQIEGNLIGLGVELWAEGMDLRIVDVFRGGPAFAAGIKPNQYILSVDGSAVDRIGAKRAADLLRGPEGSSVNLVLRNTDDTLTELTVQRKKVDVPSVAVAEMAEPGVGYVRITNFQKTTAGEVTRAMMDLSRAGMQSIIIDLRRNPGGLLDSAVELADYFISRGAIVSTKGRNGQENHVFNATVPGTWDIPLVVLIDGDSASASEIFAGAIVDHNRGTVVGQTSYGKGSVQGVFHNEHGNGGLRLTVSKFFSPKGTPISQRGVQPHIVVEEEMALDKNDIAALKPAATDSKQFVSKSLDKVDIVALKPAINDSKRFISKTNDKPDLAKDRAILEAKQKINFGR
jgi:carboxyl-terminal processing protease